MFPSLVVFPGGTVGPVDRAYSDPDPDVHVDLDHRAAALRELSEETGLLAITGRVVASRPERGTDIYDCLEAHGWSLDVASLVMVSRWVTPEAAPHRFDTRFYLLSVSRAPEVRIDDDELVGHAWVTPDQALGRAASGDWAMILPTIAHLRWLSRRFSIEDALASAAGADGRTLIRPRLIEDGSLVPVHLPADR
jgi:8-oxo-dGTP pyrophosphatase MutT (NUDIX family)